MREKESRPAGNQAANDLGGSITDSLAEFPVNDPIYEARLQSWLEGYHARDHEVSQLNWTADRYYAEMCRRTPPRTADLPRYSDLERIRGNHEHADQVDAANARRFAGVSR